ncbi:SDR family oxidoreductase [Arenicella xantha]|uniref:NADP-dependent 3-hydroxy acid dehydrogenase YdfG n=1 Tax=Arenicella xantha TaxID=644221 RepID=A0A395JKI7_9GAMM|nr:SDR family oxidoreductase [Arenicella xantha]RBP51303.1 NADP-dependent 3-hydroxy acid dehydrogenase YdfG [Arenicella xantha]
MPILKYCLIALLFSFSASAYSQASAPLKPVLITGASSGLGLRMTEVLSQNGFLVYAGARKPEDLKRLEAMPNVEAIKLDVLVPAEIDAAVETVKQKGRGLFGLINNAGVAVFGPIIEVDVAELEYQLNVNVLGPYRVTQAFSPLIIESKGRIATTGSIAGTLAGPMFGHYSMSKHAIEAFTDALAVEMMRFGVTVSVIEPGNYASQIGNTAKKRMLARDYWSAETRYTQEREGMLQGLEMVTKGADPLAVAEAALDIMQSDKPKRRYMVVDQASQAETTVRKALQKALQLNQGQKHQFDSAKLIEMLQQEQQKLVESN